MFIVNHKKIFFGISIALVAASFVFMSVFSLQFGIDFTGGSVLEVSYESRPENGKVLIEEKLSSIGQEGFVVRETGDTGYIIKTKTIDEASKNNLISEISFDGKKAEEKRFNTVGPTLGNELKTRASVALVIVILAIIMFIAYTFRAVSKPVSSWKYGLVAIIALVHDVIITIGFFSLMGHYLGTEVDTLFVTALLVILGYSINDTIVVLDRVRENLKDKQDNIKDQKFEEIVGQSLKETFTRSINTSLTTLLSLGALYVLGGIATQSFALALIVGIVSGTYSSIFVAAPLLVVFKNSQKPKKS